MSSTLPPLFPIDPEHRGASVIIPSFTFISYTVIVAGLRFWLGRGTENNGPKDLATDVLACVRSCDLSFAGQSLINGL